TPIVSTTERLSMRLTGGMGTISTMPMVAWMLLSPERVMTMGRKRVMLEGEESVRKAE
ncbi:hypothetical protein Pmar_PMAR008182, partial [Perkinsus marinus ATCC 50983]